MRPYLLLLILLLVGCSDEFERYSQLSSLRVMAMRSEPAIPRLGQEAKLQALVYGTEAIEYRWSLCPVAAKARDGYACPISPEAAVGVFGTGLPTLAPDRGPEAALTHGLASSTLAALCEQGLLAPGYANSVDCDLGFPITVVLDVRSGEQSLRAAFLVYLPTGDDATSDNHNPTILGLTADGLPMMDTMAVAPGGPKTVTASIATDAVEIRPVFPFEMGTGARPERLTFSWFSDVGSWKKDRTSFIDGETTLADAATNVWTAPDVLPDSVFFAVVVRDDRGGVGWLERKLTIEARP